MSNALAFADELEALDGRPAAAAVKLNCVALSTIETRKISWLWDNRIPEGTLTLVEGDGGRGKSTIIAAICSSLTRGEPLPGETTQREPKRVLLLAAEDDPGAVLRPRFEANGADLTRILFDDQSMILNESGIQALVDAIREHKIDVVIIDPIVSFLGQRIDMNKGNDVRSVLGPLVKLGRETGCTFIVVRHFNKSREGSASQKGAGSVDFRNAARSVLQVIHANEVSYLALEKTNYAARAKTLSFSISGGKIVWGEASDLTADQLHGETQSSSDSKSAMDEAIAFLKEELNHGAKAAGEISKAARDLGISDKTLQRAKGKVGVRSVKGATGWRWMIQEGQGGQDSHVPLAGNLDHVDHLAGGQSAQVSFL